MLSTQIDSINLNENRFAKNSFRRQLTLVFSIGILTLALVSSLTTAWVTANSVYNQMVEDGVLVTKSLSKQTILALLYDSAENADDAINAALAFPSVRYVRLLDIENSIIAEKGNYKAEFPSDIFIGEQAMLVKETTEEWYFSAPVYSEGQITSDDHPMLYQDEPSLERLGAVILIISKNRLNKTVTATILNNLGITLLIATLLFFIIYRSYSRLTEPLSELSQVMRKAEQGETKAYATPKGPIEVQNIGKTFNNMMAALAERDAKLRQHNELLEYEVDQRTQELVYARDMAIQASRDKSDFLSSISHELRTPLQSIIGYSDLILETLPLEFDEIRMDQETIVKNANHLLDMINSVLDMAKLDSGRMKLRLEETDLVTIIEGAVATITPLAKSNGNELKTETDLEVNYHIIDGAKLRHIFLNLLSNANKFTQDGTVTFSIRSTEDEILFSVADTGIGMEPAQLENIFNPFYQIEGGETRRFQGTGLGLAITKQFCELMGGNIEVRSTPGSGSTFEVRIPLPIKETY